MRKGIDLVALAAKITANQQLKHDLIASTAETRMVLDGDRKPMLHVEATDANRGVAYESAFPILPLAHRQIATHAGIPAPYYDRMRADQPTLLTENVNTWFKAQPEKRMIRTLGGDARAFLSNRYQRIENEEIAEVALPIIYSLPKVQLVSCEVTERRLYIHFVVPTIEGEVKKNDVVQAGGIISNSEVGLGSVSVSGLIWRLVCLNGMKTADTYRRNHVGRQIEDSEALWADDTKKSDDRTVLLKVRDMVRAVVDETRFRKQIDEMKRLAGIELAATAQPAKVVEILAQKVGATEAEQGGILQSLIRGGDLSAWGLLNAVTHQAHSTENYDRAVEFEAMGGRLLAMPQREWAEVLQAA